MKYLGHLWSKYHSDGKQETFKTLFSHFCSLELNLRSGKRNSHIYTEIIFDHTQQNETLKSNSTLFIFFWQGNSLPNKTDVSLFLNKSKENTMNWNMWTVRRSLFTQNIFQTSLSGKGLCDSMLICRWLTYFGCKNILLGGFNARHF